jgi:hypothetical protein
MSVVTRAAFARLAGVSPAAITLGVRRSLLVPEADGRLDTEHPVNAAYLAEKGGGAPAEKPAQKPRARKPRAERRLPEPPPAVDDEEDGESAGALVSLKIKRAEADLHLKIERRLALEQRRLERERVLLEKQLVDQMIAVLGSQIKIRLLDLPRRITPQVVALVQSGQPTHEIEALLEREIGDAVKQSKEEAKRAGLDCLT